MRSINCQKSHFLILSLARVLSIASGMCQCQHWTLSHTFWVICQRHFSLVTEDAPVQWAKGIKTSCRIKEYQANIRCPAMTSWRVIEKGALHCINAGSASVDGRQQSTPCCGPPLYCYSIYQHVWTLAPGLKCCGALWHKSTGTVIHTCSYSQEGCCFFFVSPCSLTRPLSMCPLPTCLQACKRQSVMLPQVVMLCQTQGCGSSCRVSGFVGSHRHMQGAHRRGAGWWRSSQRSWPAAPAAPRAAAAWPRPPPRPP